MQPRRLEKNANITLKSAVLPQAVSHTGIGASRGSNYSADVWLCCLRKRIGASYRNFRDRSPEFASHLGGRKVSTGQNRRKGVSPHY
jgi:hypothetical protein